MCFLEFTNHNMFQMKSYSEQSLHVLTESADTSLNCAFASRGSGVKATLLAASKHRYCLVQRCNNLTVLDCLITPSETEVKTKPCIS